MNETYSIQESLQGRLYTFIRDSGFRSICAEEFIRDLVVLLSAYREEDLALFAEVYVVGAPSSLSALLINGPQIALGHCVASASNAAAAVLKDCATLATGGWAIFALFESDEHIKYGVFRATRHSLSTGADEAMQGLGTETQIMLVRNRGHQTVELQNTSDLRLTALFKISATTTPALGKDVGAFIEAAVSGIDDCAEARSRKRSLFMEVRNYLHVT